MQSETKASGPWRLAARSVPDVVRDIRDTRFSGGLRCVRCGSARVQRWGGFSNRQRYRCRGCGRTFSDLTGTPAAYSKKVELWPAYARCFEAGLSVRVSAARVSIDPSTAFRWRHALAKGLRETDREKLYGRTEVSTDRLPESCKGQRGLGRAARRRGYWSVSHHGGPYAYVFCACDRVGHVVSQMRRSRGPEEWDQALAGRFEGQPIIVGIEGFDGRPSQFAQRIGAAFEDGRSVPWPKVWTVKCYIRRFRAWMARFRGVATKYLPNYLVWHRSVDAAFRHGVAAKALRWPVCMPMRE